jgi:hypothetical protein
VELLEIKMYYIISIPLNRIIKIIGLLLYVDITGKLFTLDGIVFNENPVTI